MYDWGKSWLGKYLTERGISPELVRLCEEKLVIQEGFASPVLLLRMDRYWAAFDRIYLNKLGITALFVCETILTLHSDLNCAYDHTGVGGATGSASAARDAVKILFPDFKEDGTSGVPTLETDMPSHLSWLGLFLTQNGVSSNFVRLCEEKLVRKEGLGNPLILARITDRKYFNRDYLWRLGITGLGLREALLALHGDLQTAFEQQPLGSFEKGNGFEDAARAAVKIVLPSYTDVTTAAIPQQLEPHCDKQKLPSVEEGSEAGSEQSWTAFDLEETTA